MATYTVTRNADHTFHVAIVGNDGARQTLLGFATQAEAEAWITWDRCQSAVEDSRTTSGLLMPADF
jgi:hypothetical protein